MARLTDHIDMTKADDWDVETTKHHKAASHKILDQISCKCWSIKAFAAHKCCSLDLLF